MKNAERFQKAVREVYPKETLVKLFEKYFLDWMIEGWLGKDLENPMVNCMITKESDAEVFYDIFERIFQEKNFKKIFPTLPQEVQDVFIGIAWDGEFCIDEEKEKYFVGNSAFNIQKNIRADYMFFQARKDLKRSTYLMLHYDIVRELRNLLPKKPPTYKLKPIKTKINAMVANDENVFVKNIKNYYEFYSQGGVGLSASGKILKDSKINMCKYCNIDEYYKDEKELYYIKTETIALLFHLMKDEYVNEEIFTNLKMKELVLDFMNGKLQKEEEKNHFIYLYLNYLKGVKNIEDDREAFSKALGTIINVIKEFPVTEKTSPVISVQNIIDRILFRDEFVEILNLETVYSSIYINEANYERTKIESYEQYLEYIVRPFIKTVFFILGVMGVFEIYYDKPNYKNRLYLRNGYLSKFEGIVAVKLTEFGKFVFDFDENCSNVEVKEEGKIHLEEDRLIITILGEAPSKSMFIEKISQKITSNKYKVSNGTFLRTINTKEELENKIKAFKANVSEEIPQCWEEFFMKLEANSESIGVIPDYTALKIKNDKALIEAIAKEERLKNYIIKGEGYHLFVKTESLDKVIEIFKELGYFIEK